MTKGRRIAPRGHTPIVEIQRAPRPLLKAQGDPQFASRSSINVINLTGPTLPSSSQIVDALLLGSRLPIWECSRSPHLARRATAVREWFEY